jgi:hypothetical protein
MQLSSFHNEFTFCLTYVIHYGMVIISNDVSYLWQMVRTRAIEDAMFDIPEGSAGRGCGCGHAP